MNWSLCLQNLYYFFVDLYTSSEGIIQVLAEAWCILYKHLADAMEQHYWEVGSCSASPIMYRKNEVSNHITITTSRLKNVAYIRILMYSTFVSHAGINRCLFWMF